MPTLDELLGRQSLKDRIASLETEIDRLESQLEAEQDRRSEAVRDRQAAQERVNQLEDRIAGLEGELERQETDDDARTWSRVESVGHERAADLVDRLRSWRGGSETAFSAAIEGVVSESVRSLLSDDWVLVEEVAPCLVYLDDRLLVRVVLDVPQLPEPFDRWDDTFRIEAAWLFPTGPGIFAVARGDLFAMGRYDDGELEYVHGFESEVMGKHSKGGFSQARFERRRDEQIDAHVDRCRAELTDVDASEVVLVGDRRIVSRLSTFATATGTVDASGSPESALRAAFRDYWTTRLYIP